MLLKWLFLLAVAYYISRAVGNLIRAASGEQKRVDQSEKEQQTDIHHSAHSHPHSDSNIRDRVHDRGVEDAQFKDL